MGGDGRLEDKVSGPAGGYSRISTHGLDASERIELWEQHNARALFDLSARSLDGQPFEASETNLRLPEVILAHISTNPHIIERNQQHIARSGAEGVMIFFSLVGDTFFHHRNGNHAQRPGTLLICDLSRPFLRGFAHGLQEYVAVVPRDVFETTTGRMMPHEPIVMSFAGQVSGNPHARALARLMRQSLSKPAPAAAAGTEQRFLELMSAMLSPGSEGSAVARRRAATVWISQHLGDPSISVGAVARGIGVSERSLARAFGETGRGVARTILEMRLAAAHRLLAAPEPATVQEIAQNCGFVSAAHFSRVFRDRYGVAPSEARASGLVATFE